MKMRILCLATVLALCAGMLFVSCGPKGQEEEQPTNDVGKKGETITKSDTGDANIVVPGQMDGNYTLPY